ncbi:MAG TPA: heparan-alpha-glucosaminide N-acetyltransferase domain-containing protein [Methanocorpusculum sp.]|nr:heparan-alpha-glucosaminide N-acetyltransferase domain-containing protein [Methanocorpusculum sp.]
MGERYWEVDAVRGIALVGMIVYHFLACMVIFHMIIEDEEFLSYYELLWNDQHCIGIFCPHRRCCPGSPACP